MESFKPNLALLIDFENVGADPRVDIAELVAAADARGRTLIKRAYADWARFEDRKKRLAEHGVDLIELPAHGKPRKNAADIRLVVDAMEIALSLSHIGGFVIASGDSDFIPMFAKLRELGKRVVVASVQDAMSALLEVHCDELLALTRQEPVPNVAATPKPAAVRATQAKSAPAKSTAPKPAQPKSGQPKPKRQGAAAATAALPRKAKALLHRALAEIAAANAVAQSSRIKVTMRRLDPGFDEAKLGFKRFSDFLKAAAGADATLELKMDSGRTDYVLISVGQSGERTSKPKQATGDVAEPAPDTAVKVKSMPTYGPDQGVIATMAYAMLADGPMQCSHLARALKQQHFADDHDVSAFGLYGRIGRLIKSGALCELLVDRRSVVSLPEAQQASNSRYIQTHRVICG
jgi:hypothetical protein